MSVDIDVRRYGAPDTFGQRQFVLTPAPELLLQLPPASLSLLELQREAAPLDGPGVAQGRAGTRIYSSDPDAT